MISDNDIKQLFALAQGFLAQNQSSRPSKPRPQFYRGISPLAMENQHPGSCTRHMAVFDKFNIIPNYCFSCFKVVIEPRTVVELFKLMVIFKELRLPKDNTRKCMVELRPSVPGTYKGLIYCRSFDEGNQLVQGLRHIISGAISEEASRNIPVNIKRGCSEFGKSYPDYPKAGPEASLMQYKPEWKEKEDLADTMPEINKPPLIPRDNYNVDGYDLDDAEAMLIWVTYAATIGDQSYRKIVDHDIEPSDKYRRPPA